MAMNLNNLKIFINAADTHSITKAAEALHITQPAASKAIKNLEEDLGVTLFFRDKRNGILLTDTGERVLDFARQMLLMEERIYQTAYLSKNMLEGTLKIATLPNGMNFFVVKALAHFQAKYPHVNVEITEASTLEVNHMVAEHAAEFGISLAPATDFEHELLMEDRIMAICKAPVETGRVDLSKPKQRFYVCQAAWEAISPILEQHHIKEDGRFKIVGAQTVRALAAEGIDIGLQAASILPKETDAYYKYPVEPEIRTDFLLIANRFEDLSPAAKAFIEIIRAKKQPQRSSF